jgi:hypothetical protein
LRLTQFEPPREKNHWINVENCYDWGKQAEVVSTGDQNMTGAASANEDCEKKGSGISQREPRVVAVSACLVEKSLRDLFYSLNHKLVANIFLTFFQAWFVKQT